MTQDEVAVLHLINRYGVAVDSRKWDVFDELFTGDVVADYGGGAAFNGLAAFKAGAAMAWGGFDASQHAMSNTVWDLGKETGRTLTYGGWCIIRKGTPGGDVWEGKGWYDDELVRSKSGWRIRRRSVRVMWWSGNSRVMQSNPSAGDVQIKTYSLNDEIQGGTVGFFRK